MSTRPPKNGIGPLDHLALRYLRRALDTVHPTDEPYVLNPAETRMVQRTKILTLSLAALLGVLGVLSLYIPQYNWPEFFQNTPVSLFDTTFQLPLITIIYGILIVYVEVHLLIGLNLLGVKTIMHVCQFPRAHDAQYDRHLRALADAALEKTQHGLLRYGIDPYLNMPRWGLTIFFLLNQIKAILSQFLIKILFRRLLGRYALRQFTDLLGMPVFAIWNAYASWQVLHEAQVRVMAPTTIREFVNELYDEWGRDAEFHSHILEALQYVAILKRQYNYAHFLLTETLVDRFSLQTDKPPTGEFLNQIATVSPTARQSLERLIIFGVLVDGRLSWVEKRQLRKLQKKGFLTYSIREVQKLGREYNQGKGLWV